MWITMLITLEDSMEIQIIVVGKLKEKYLKSGIAEYLKRMKSYVNLKIIEVKDEAANQMISDAEIEQVKEIEEKQIIEELPERARVIALDLQGNQLSSEAFSEEINEIMTYGTSQIAFIIGGSHGLSPEVLQKTHLKISFGSMTYPHQLMRLILVEQIYRAFKIMR